MFIEIKKDNLTYVDSLKFYTYYILSDYYPKLEQKADGYTSDDNLFKDNIEEDIFYRQFSNDVLDIIVNKRANDIIRLHYGLDGDDPMYQEEIARMMQVRQSLVSSLEQIAFKTIKKHVKTPLNFFVCVRLLHVFFVVHKAPCIKNVVLAGP